ncbi:hypothetical protein G3O08_17310 [Cryomorpha ignava]|uniref:PSP1 C-terminal domain-containing protein n=1 Tax=Cryomorpha ignava TaxID=101383 RepID=A0A7K3WUP3_9FLAO|nr:regulatory iron-sulfur-containing complex subunit RicT [Cryomorpha ignava]NEN25258.1 hypothetical protein [Cryomorpha ignava]
MGCESCSNGKGGTPAGCKNNGTCSTGGCSKLAVFDWLGNMELPGNATPFEYVEIRFKNGRKEFFRNATKSSLNPGDAVVVEGSPGHDLGIISASGELARLQMETKRAMKNARDSRKVLRKATSEDMDKWREARGREEDTMYKSRTIAIALGLEMKISDIEFQADNTKATFYYTAEGRVDFRELIKKFADTFKVRIEMKQIGARQEAGRLGGIGSCGRELCCSTWLTDFRSVSTSAARYQQLALNTQKLAGQCGKLKCCLNYELDSYLDALSTFPKNYNRLKTKKGIANHLKTDIFKGIMWYIYDEDGISIPVPLHKDRVAEILEMNNDDKFPIDLKSYVETEEPKEVVYGNVVGQDSLTRFDEGKKKSKNRKKRRNPNQKDGQKKSPQANTKGASNRGDSPQGKSKSDNPAKSRKNKPKRRNRNQGDAGKGNSDKGNAN